MEVAEKYCFRCASPLPPGAAHCPRCGAPTGIHYTAKPPRPRLTPGFAAAILVLGAAAFVLSYALPPLPASLSLEASTYLLPAGAAVLAAALLWRKGAPWEIELFVPLGAALVLFEHVMVFVLHVEAPALIYVFKAGIAVMAAAAASWLMARREARILNVKPPLSRAPLALSLSTALLLELVFATGGAFSPLALERALLGLTALGVATWLTWHFYAPRVFEAYLNRSAGEEAVMLDTGVSREELGYQFTEMLLRSFTLVLMVFSIVILGVQVFAPQLSLSSVPDLVKVAKYSLAAEVLLGVFGPPAYWLSDALDLRVLDRASMTLEKAAPIEALDSMVDAFALLGFLLTLRDATLAITPPQESPAVYVPVAVFNSILLLFYFTVITLPPALIATALYHKYSFKRHVEHILSRVKPTPLHELPSLLQPSKSWAATRQTAS